MKSSEPIIREPATAQLDCRGRAAPEPTQRLKIRGREFVITKVTTLFTPKWNADGTVATHEVEMLPVA